ncbi:MAG TPA: NrfD/PsrC family molybdoenzyme membrane anchor subunit, partial [Propionibacteriaceae bacterium]|nr:NrfD/PsrC family molybdoenzyme membrane anchor subunit [Propionibacteriaceae bacterium]
MTTSPFDADRPPEQPRRRRRDGEDGGKRRGDPNATVPDADFTSYYGRPVVKPAPWKATIPAYIFLGGLAAGSGLVGAGAHLTGRPTLRRHSRVGAMVAVAAGAAALIEDLGRPERALNMMRTVKLTSPMSVGSWILAGFSSFTGAALGLELLRSRVPASGVAGKALAVADPVTSAGAAFFAPPLAAYTAVLLADTATPLWHESYRELPFLFVASATAAGAGLSQITAPTSETGPVRALAVLGAAADLASDWMLEKRLGEEQGRPLKEGRPHQLHRAARILTVAGAVGTLLTGRHRVGAALSGLALVAGSACTRFALFDAGIASARDPQYTMRAQRARVDKARA